MRSGQRPLRARAGGLPQLIAVPAVVLAILLGALQALAESRYSPLRDDYLKSMFGLTKVSVRGSPFSIASLPVLHDPPSRRAVFFIDGDVPEKDISAATYRKVTEGISQVFTRMSRLYDADFYYVARPGYFTSSGDHDLRQTETHYRAVGLAIRELIKAKGYEVVALAGQSGGSMAVMAISILGLVEPKCVAVASGAYYFDLNGRNYQAKLDKLYQKYGGEATNRFLERMFQRHYEIGRHVSELKADAERRIYVVADPDDHVVSFRGEKKFADALLSLKHKVTFESLTATDKDHHGLAGQALRRATDCIVSVPLPAAVAAAKSRSPVPDLAPEAAERPLSEPGAEPAPAAGGLTPLKGAPNPVRAAPSGEASKENR